MTQTTGSLTYQYNLLMHAYTHMFCMPLFRKTDWLPFSAGGEAFFFSFGNGSWAPFYEILKAKLQHQVIAVCFLVITPGGTEHVTLFVCECYGGGLYVYVKV